MDHGPKPLRRAQSDPGVSEKDIESTNGHHGIPLPHGVQLKPSRSPPRESIYGKVNALRFRSTTILILSRLKITYLSSFLSSPSLC